MRQVYKRRSKMPLSVSLSNSTISHSQIPSLPISAPKNSHPFNVPSHQTLITMQLKAIAVALLAPALLCMASPLKARNGSPPKYTYSCPSTEFTLACCTGVAAFDLKGGCSPCMILAPILLAHTSVDQSTDFNTQAAGYCPPTDAYCCQAVEGVVSICLSLMFATKSFSAVLPDHFSWLPIYNPFASLPFLLSAQEVPKSLEDRASWTD